MWPDTIHYHTTYKAGHLPKAKLLHFLAEVPRRIDVCPLRSVEVKFASSRQYLSSPCLDSAILDAIDGDYETLESYTLAFGEFTEEDQSPWDAELSLTMLVRDAHNTTSPPRARVWGVQCALDDFLKFLDVIENTLSLQIHPECVHELQDCIIEQNLRALAHTGLKELISSALKDGQHDVALRTATALVEDTLRKKCAEINQSPSKHQSGAELAVAAYHEVRGCLNPPWPIAAEARQGVQLLFQGFFKYIRNAFAHRVHVMGEDRSGVLECLQLCAFLLHIIERSTPRPGPCQTGDSS